MTSVCVFGCKDTTRHFIGHIKDITPIDALVTLTPAMAAEQKVAGYDDLSDLSATVKHLYKVEKYHLKTETDTAFFAAHDFDIAFVVGWQRLLPEEVLHSLRIGAFGMHGSAQNLPYGRGRSPMNWSIIEGRQWFYTNLFRYSTGVDDGPVVDTLCFSIHRGDTAESLHYKNTVSMVSIVTRNWRRLAANTFTTVRQAEGTPTYYPKRDLADGLIDWSDDISNIERLVRAVAPPFPGAFSYLADAKLFIDRAAVFYTDVEQHPFLGAANGTVCDIFPSGKFLVRCNGGVLLVHEARGAPASGVTRGAHLVSPPGEIKRFPRNPHGYFDLPQ